MKLYKTLLEFLGDGMIHVGSSPIQGHVILTMKKYRYSWHIR